MAHEFDGIRADGDWIIAELKGASGTTGSGRLVVPEASRHKHWEILSVGPDYKGIGQVGDRIFVQTFPSGQMGPCVTVENFDGRTFCLLRPSQIIAVLEKHAAPALVEPTKADLKLVRPS